MMIVSIPPIWPVEFRVRFNSLGIAIEKANTTEKQIMYYPEVMDGEEEQKE